MGTVQYHGYIDILVTKQPEIPYVVILKLSNPYVVILILSNI